MPATCPICKRIQPVAKVSAIYIAGIELKRSARRRQPEAPTPREPAAGKPAPAEPTWQVLQSHQPWKDLTRQQLIALSARLAPPESARKAGLRPINPDWIMLGLAMVTPIFLIGVYTTQPEIILPVFVVLIAAQWLYVWKRKSLVGRFRAQREAERLADERVKTGIERWLKLSYCLDDDVVFEPGRGAPLPADQMQQLLFSAETQEEDELPEGNTQTDD